MRDSTVDCGGGADEALIDQFDGASSSCESVSVTTTAVLTVFAGLTLDNPGLDQIFSTGRVPSEWTPFVVWVETPATGGREISIGAVSVTNTPPAGATFQGPQYMIATQGAGMPLRITFWIDHSARLPESPAVFRDGLKLPSCTGAATLPAGVSACVTDFVPHEFSNRGGWSPMEIAVLSDRAGSWNLGWYPIPDDRGGGGGGGNGSGGPPLPTPPQPPPRLPPLPFGGGGGHTAPPGDTSGPVIPGRAASPVTTVRGRRFVFTIGPFSEPVTGTVALVSNAIRSGGRNRRIKLAARPFTAAPGTRVKLSFKLTRKQRRLLAKARRVRMTATVIARDALGNASRRKVDFQLRSARRRR